MLRIRFLSIAYIFIITSCSLNAATRYSNQDQERTLIKKLYDNVEMMRHEMKNNESEILMFGEKIANMEDTIEDLRNILDKLQASYQEQIKSNKDAIDSKVSNFVGDIKQLQSHANNSSTVIDSYQGQIAHLQKIIDSRNKDLDNLKTAVKSIMNAIGSTEEVSENYEIYKVQPGDSLGVIAQKQNKTIREIKDLNGLKNDVIIVGQKLKIPL